MAKPAEKIVTARAEHPEWTLSQIGKAAGVSREYVRQVLKEAGLSTTAQSLYSRFHPGTLRETWVDRFGPNKVVTTHAAGAVAELSVVRDLLSRGINVYRAMHAHSACDLIAMVGEGMAVRIEVRSGKRKADGKLAYSAPDSELGDRYDVLAVALPDGELIYKPELSQWQDIALRRPTLKTG